MLFSDGSKGDKFSKAGVGENNVDSSLRLGDSLVETIEVGQFGNVSLNATNIGADCLRGRVELLPATSGNENISTLPHEEFCRGQPNPFCAASDDSDLAFEFFRHSFLPMFGKPSRCEDDAKFGFSAHHAGIASSSLCQRVPFDHWTHARHRGEAQRVLGIGGDTASPTLDTFFAK